MFVVCGCVDEWVCVCVCVCWPCVLWVCARYAYRVVDSHATIRCLDTWFELHGYIQAKHCCTIGNTKQDLSHPCTWACTYKQRSNTHPHKHKMRIYTHNKHAAMPSAMRVMASTRHAPRMSEPGASGLSEVPGVWWSRYRRMRRSYSCNTCHTCFFMPHMLPHACVCV